MPDKPKKNINHRPEYSINEKFENQIKNQQDWSGDFLKKVREYKNLTLGRVSEITKISAFYVNAIESMDSHNLPALVFVRGYVSQICKVLGVDEKKVCDSYMRLFKEKIGNQE